MSRFEPVRLEHASRRNVMVAAAADPAVFANGRWNFNEHNAALQTIHHLGAGQFVRSGGTVQAQRLP